METDNVRCRWVCLLAALCNSRKLPDCPFFSHVFNSIHGASLNWNLVFIRNPLPNSDRKILWGFPFTGGQIDQISIWRWSGCLSDVRLNKWMISFLVTERQKWRSLMWLWSTFLVTRQRGYDDDRHTKKQKLVRCSRVFWVL